MAKKHPSAPFRKVRKQQNPSSESFGTLPHLSERTAEHVLTVRAVAKRFENAGVPRTERSIINWCQPNPHGIPRLDCFFDNNEHKYFITPGSVDHAIGEERNKLKIQGQTAHSETLGNLSENANIDSEAFGTRPDSFGTLPKGAEAFGNDMSSHNSRKLEMQILDLQITNKAKEMFIEQLKETNDKLIDNLKHTSHQLGQLEHQVRQLQSPRERSHTSGEPNQSIADASADETPPVQVVKPANDSTHAPSHQADKKEAKPEEPGHPINAEAEASDYQELIDPHGDLAEAVLPFIPKARRKHLVYINPTDLDYPVALNLMGQVKENERHLVAENLLAIFHKIWQDSWGPRMAYLLRNTLLALLESPGSTLLSIPKLLTDEKHRERVVRNLSDPFVRHYWEREFAAFPERLRAEVISPVQNKVGAYLSNRLLRNILGQSSSTIHFRTIIDQGNILIVNLCKGRLGEEAANLLGSFIVSGLQQAAMARASLPEDERRDFYLYIDEFQNFTTDAFASALSEIRKYRLSFILAHQYLGQLTDNIRDSVLANVGTLVLFRLGSEDAETFGKEFGTDWPVSNLVSLNPYEIFYKLMQKGTVQGPYQATTMPPPKALVQDLAKYKQELLKASRRRYSRPRAQVEAKISRFLG